MSSFATLCDAFITDIQTNVPELATATVHKYSPANPEDRSSSVGERHLNVFPEGEAEAAERFTTGGNMFTRPFVILVWEDASEVDGRRMQDETADAAMLDIAEAVRARFHVKANQTLGGAFQIDYRGIQLPTETSPARWFVVRVTVFSHQDFV